MSGGSWGQFLFEGIWERGYVPSNHPDDTSYTTAYYPYSRGMKSDLSSPLHREHSGLVWGVSTLFPPLFSLTHYSWI